MLTPCKNCFNCVYYKKMISSLLLFDENNNTRFEIIVTEMIWVLTPVNVLSAQTWIRFSYSV